MAEGAVPPSVPGSGPDVHESGVSLTPEVDKRHGDPEQGGLTSGQKSAVARGYMPANVADTEQEAAAKEYAEQKGVDPDSLRVGESRKS
eukprot:scaffold15.g4357.t1